MKIKEINNEDMRTFLQEEINFPLEEDSKEHIDHKQKLKELLENIK